MNARYKQSSPEDQLIEECSELIKALCKMKRFGKTAIDPHTGIKYDNLADCRAEISDVKQSIHRCLVTWSETE